MDSFGETSDWIELYNSASTPLSLFGYYLSDDASELDKWSFPAVIIPAQAYLVVWASDRDLLTPMGEVHTNFKISNGESILLSSPTLNIIDQVTLPNLAPDNSLGRLNDASPQWAYFQIPTPGESNQSQQGYLELLTLPQANHPSGFYVNPISLSLTTSEAATQIWYTLDCSIPSPENPSAILFDSQAPLSIMDRTPEPNDISLIRTTLPWDGTSANWIHKWFPPLGQVKKVTVIRTRSYKPGCLPSEEQILTYFIGSEFLPAYQNLPVISLVTERANLFSDLTGIYVPGTDSLGNPYPTADLANYNQGWERETHIQLWEADRQSGFKTRAITEIHGSGSSRMNRKGLRFEFKGSQGIPNLAYDLFADGTFESYDAFVVRASGQDAHHAIFRDASIHTMFLQDGIDASRSRPVILFVNGEYWGVHNIRERSDEEYVARIHDLDVDKLDCLENTNRANPVARVGNNDRFNQLRDFLRNNDISIPANYDILNQFIDIENFAKYYIAQIFVANSDWPSYNLRYWRYKPELDIPGQYFNPNPDNPYQDGRFRWLLYDLDQSLGRYHTYNANTLQACSNVGSWNDYIYFTFRKMIGATDASGLPVPDGSGTYSNGSPQFRQLFINYFCDALNTRLLPSRTTEKITQFQNQYNPYMPEHIARWQLPESMSFWNSVSNAMRSFLNNRPAAILTHLANKFQLLGGTATLSLNINNSAMGHIRLNSLDLGANPGFEPLPFSGVYFQNNPVKIKAIANPGYRFVGWIGTTEPSDSLMFSLAGDLQLTAVFEFDEDDFPGDTLNPEPYNLNLEPFSFLGFSADSPAGSYPPNTRFLMAPGADPNLAAEMTLPYTSPYNLTSRTRIEGLDYNGIALINTGNPPLSGTTEGYLGAVVVGLKTIGQSGLKLNFTAETMIVNERIYGIAVQYRIGTQGSFSDLMLNGEPLRYIRSTLVGHKQT
ncbi:MAG: CotH kinase family protein, partial [Candidatus Cloacimonetes bacterium]|nr:CotH kinase family protein [Candidatus Cloacimonadota bacterium]